MVKPTPLEPTPAMIEAGAQRLVSWDLGCVWPDSWDALDVIAARNDAEKAWRSMWISAAPSPEWVKVSERLPEARDADEDGMVWNWCKGRGVTQTVWNFTPLVTTHWLPKPRQEPPKPPGGDV